MCMSPSRNDPSPSLLLLCPNPLLIRSRGPHHLSYIINRTTTRHHQHNQQQQQQPISQRRYEHTLSPIWPEPRQSHWSHQPKPSSHGSVISLSPVSPVHRPHPNSTRCIARRPYVCLIRILPSPTIDSPAPDPSLLLLLLLPPPSSAVLSVSHTALLCMYSSLPFVSPAYIIPSTTSAADSNYRTFYFYNNAYTPPLSHCSSIINFLPYEHVCYTWKRHTHMYGGDPTVSLQTTLLLLLHPYLDQLQPCLTITLLITAALHLEWPVVSRSSSSDPPWYRFLHIVHSSLSLTYHLTCHTLLCPCSCGMSVLHYY